MATPVSSTVCSICGEMLGESAPVSPVSCAAGSLRVTKDPLPARSLVFGDFEIERRVDGSLWELGEARWV